ncbi:TspO and MBR like proteins [Hyella patelloides LEGE 07179]|uniref:TspO and MBR like proteins n=1 Tax=Hyella patelloides LEGE 07179 TaxID=945734 RepID=A0A563W4W4_9CYAN|nr:tryptophan-rich sensory protein [Hyella patelloides]VEP18706.1 TspO and MBR like proteins [Hyella patelloides LEGE 07179]
MTQSNDSGAVERLVNTVMGVKTEEKNRPLAKQIVVTTELDLKAILIYKLGTILQIGIMILAFWGMEKLVTVVDNNSSLPHWLGTLLTALFFTLLSIRSRIFSLLDNTRSRQTYDDVIRPKWAPPPFVFALVWMTIAVLRVISSLLVWQEMNQHFLVLPLVAFVVHLALGDTWNTIFTVERRLGAAVPVVILGPWLSALIVTILYWQIDPLAGIILAPSCVWLTVAVVLVLSIWQLNGKEPLYPLKRTSFEQ